jgi:hypothetical protein
MVPLTTPLPLPSPFFFVPTPVVRLKSELLQPYHATRASTQHLLNAQLTCETLRQCLRVVQLHEKLKLQLAAGPKYAAICVV